MKKHQIIIEDHFISKTEEERRENFKKIYLELIKKQLERELDSWSDDD